MNARLVPDLRAVAARFEPAREATGLADAWRSLEAGARSPFHAWAWVGTWLASLPAQVEVVLFRADDEAGPLALGLFGVHRERGVRRLAGGSSLWLQETGDPGLDEITVEYMGLLARPGTEATAYAALGNAMRRQRPRLRHLWLSACDHADRVAAAVAPSVKAFVRRRRAAYFVDLAALRESGRGYLDALGASTRAAMRRSQRAFEALGELRIEIATDAAQARACLDELEALHTAYWRSRGLPGAFGSDFFRDFHRRLVGSASAAGLPRLVRVHAGATCLGVMYYLRWNGRDYYYNSGLRHGLVPRDDRPGHVAHLLGVQASLADGLAAYEFMASDADYKRSFSTHVDEVACVQLRVDDWRTRVEHTALRLLGRKPPERLAAGTATGDGARRAVR